MFDHSHKKGRHKVEYENGRTEWLNLATRFVVEYRDLVWAKVKGFPFWPAQLVHEWDSGRLTRKPDVAQVLFFPNGDESIVPNNHKSLLPWIHKYNIWAKAKARRQQQPAPTPAEVKSKASKNKGKPDIDEAVAQAKEIWDASQGNQQRHAHARKVYSVHQQRTYLISCLQSFNLH
jgi:hypothetical protein